MTADKELRAEIASLRKSTDDESGTVCTSGEVLYELLRGYDIAMACQQGTVNLLAALDKARDERDAARNELAAFEGHYAL